MVLVLPSFFSWMERQQPLPGIVLSSPFMDIQPVTFFFPDIEDLTQLPTFDLSDWRIWRGTKSRRRAWIVQTYLRLKQAGYEVSISGQLPREGVVVLLVEDQFKRAFKAQFSPAHRNLFVLSIRADIEGFRSPIADAEVVQNGKFADGRRVFFIPHWPQPGLIPRDRSRGTTIRTISFKGRNGSFRKEFHSERFTGFLKERNLVFDYGVPQNGTLPMWHDYASTDLLLAVRPDWKWGKLRCEKPATKLINAWHAGVPAIVGPEYAFRELRRSDLDFIEVNSVEESISAITMLMEKPDLYEAMVENGLERARDFTPERITERWAHVLFEKVPEISAGRLFQLSRSMPLSTRRATNLLAMPPTPFEFRKQVSYVLQQLTARPQPVSRAQNTTS